MGELENAALDELINLYYIITTYSTQIAQTFFSLITAELF